VTLSSVASAVIVFGLAVSAGVVSVKFIGYEA